MTDQAEPRDEQSGRGADLHVTERELLDAINVVFREALTCETREQVAGVCLAEAERLTGSRFGFICEVNPQGRLDTIAISDPGWDACRVPGSREVLMAADLEIRGIRGLVIEQGRSMIFNEPAAHEAWIEPPEGHPPLTCFMGVPLLSMGSTLGEIGLANREGGFTPEDQTIVEALSGAFQQALLHKRAEERERHLNRVLRAIRNVNQLIVAEKDPQQLISKACRCLTETRGYGHAWIALLDEQDRPTLFAEDELGECFSGFRDALVAGELPLCCVLARERLEVVVVEERIPACGECALAPSHASDTGVAVGLAHGGRIHGVMGLSMPGAYARDAEEIALIEEVAADLGLALHGIEGHAARLRTEQEKERMEARVREAGRLEAVGRLAGGVAHDFNNMLTVISSYTEFIKEGLDDDDPLQQDLNEIRLATARAASLTRQLLAFSRKQVLQPVSLRLNKVVSELNALLTRVIGEDIDLVTTLAPDLWTVTADPVQMEQVLMNLVINARDAMPRGGALEVETANVEFDEAQAMHRGTVESGAYVMIAVSDTGVGMDDATCEQIFEPFFTTKETGKGTGLGLSTVYGIVRQSGGHVFAYSEVGQGSTFKIYLPRAGEPVGEASGRYVAPTSTGGTETILVVEDDDRIRGLVQRALTGCGYRILSAADGQKALRVCQRESGPIHLALTDVVMPNMSGAELAENLAEVRPETRVLFMSGYTGNALARRGLYGSNPHHLSKPFTPTELTSAVRQVLDADEAGE